MAVEPVAVLYSGMFLGLFFGLYGWLVSLVWTPFLLAGRVRGLFATLPPADWRASYVLWMPLPAAVWGFVFGCVFELSDDVRPPTPASPLFLAGVDGTAAASLVSLVLWPALLLYVLPSRGIDWDPAGHAPRTVAIVVAGTVWYLLVLAVPVLILSVFAGFGDAMSGPR